MAELELRRLFAGPPVAFNSEVMLPWESDADISMMADMNNDGKLDTVTVGVQNRVTGSQIGIYPGNGDGTFQSASWRFLFGSPRTDAAIVPARAIADVNRDGKKDLILSRTDDISIWVFYGNGDGTVGSGVRVPMPSGLSYRVGSLVAGDFNGDQWDDVAALPYETSTFAIFFGGAGFGSNSRLITSPSGIGATGAGDLDLDGTSDLVLASSSGASIFTKLNQATPVVTTQTGLWPGKDPRKVVVSRMLGPTARPGITVAASTLFGEARIVRNALPLNGGNWNAYDVSGFISSFDDADFNRDGFGDTVFMAWAGSTTAYYMATGNAQGGIDINTTPNPLRQIVQAATAGDINNDGYMDFVGSGQSGAGAYLQIPESLTVTTAADEDDGTASPGVGTGVSLREAVGYAARLGGGTVTFAPALGNANAVINLTRGIMPTGINGPTLTIRNDTGRITIDGSGNGSRPFVSFFGNLTVQNLTFRNFSYGNSGGVFFIGAFSPSLTIDSCTFTGNTAAGQGSIVYAEGLAPVTIRNSTFTGNGGNNLIAGYGWSNGQYITLQNNTIYGNTANGVASLVGNVYLQNNIIANNGTADVVYAGGGFVGSNNIIRTGGGPAGSLNVDPLLGALANNGGRTFTMLPAPNSPAINAAAAIGLTLDQRGTARPQGALPDIGAVERAATAAQITAATFESSTRQAVNFTFNAEASVSFSRANITLTNLTTSQASTAGALSWNAAGTQASLVLTNQLADGNYRMQSGATTLDFTVFAGDFNGDRTANFDDLLILASNYNQTGKTNAQGDANYDGQVNFDDLLKLAANYNKSQAAGQFAPVIAPPAPGNGTNGGDDTEGAPAGVLL